MNWNSIYPVLSILVPIFLGMWAIMRSIKEEIRSVKSDLKGDMHALEAGLKGDIRSVKEDMRSLESSLKGDIRALEARLSGLEKECSAINVKVDYLGYDNREDRKHG
ncbi:MAG: hypothetical protein S4CHLAM2_04950 [Chlamydiales bacterium]|nr:hypothetical protein [Chlamydiales bacterium]